MKARNSGSVGTVEQRDSRTGTVEQRDRKSRAVGTGKELELWNSRDSWNRERAETVGTND